MREILFRGKRVDNGEWVKGCLCSSTFLNNTVTIIFVPCEIFGFDMVAVDPETVGQFTGLTDKNGKKIFEGDVVKNECSDSCVVKHGRHNLSCCGCCFYSHDSMGFYLYSKHNYVLSEENVWDDLEIIGNIHDNPELLKGGDENA